jgi:hypothetical protein
MFNTIACTGSGIDQTYLFDVDFLLHRSAHRCLLPPFRSISLPILDGHGFALLADGVHRSVLPLCQPLCERQIDHGPSASLFENVAIGHHHCSSSVREKYFCCLYCLYCLYGVFGFYCFTTLLQAISHPFLFFFPLLNSFHSNYQFETGTLPCVKKSSPCCGAKPFKAWTMVRGTVVVVHVMNTDPSTALGRVVLTNKHFRFRFRFI